jgi:hypothetical protein
MPGMLGICGTDGSCGMLLGIEGTEGIVIPLVLP